MSSLNLSFATYNSHGHGTGRLDYVKKIAHENDFLFVQEHWLFNQQVGMLEQKIPDCHVYLVSGMIDQSLLRGRPYGGCAIIWKKNLDCSCTPITFNSKRVCAMLLEMKGAKIILVSVYMPCDTSCGDDHNSRKHQG